VTVLAITRPLHHRQDPPRSAECTPLRMAPADAAWLQMDEANNPADVILLMTFDAAPTPEAVRGTVTRRLLRFAPFRQRVVEIHGRPHWTVDDEFEVDNHLVCHDLDGRLDAGRLAGVVADLASGVPERDRPLWSLHLVRGTDGGGALALRVHHCVADGMALAHAVSFPERKRRGEKAATPVGPPRRAPSALARGVGHVRGLGHLLLVPFGREIVLRQPLTGRRRMAWSTGYPLDIVKARARARGATLNDVCMAAITGAVRRFLDERGELLPGRSVRAIVPVNLRPTRWVEDVGDSLGNYFGLFFIDLPVEERSPQARLRALGDRIRAGDRLAEASATREILKVLGRGPAYVERFASRRMTRKVSLVVSNVPGPRGLVYFGEKRIREVMFWEPHPGRVGLALSILTYDGTVRMGARVDEAITDDPNRIVTWFEEELSVLLEG
jgi:diacylglycerol O-acyltransferase